MLIQPKPRPSVKGALMTRGAQHIPGFVSVFSLGPNAKMLILATEAPLAIPPQISPLVTYTNATTGEIIDFYEVTIRVPRLSTSSLAKKRKGADRINS
jgi:hypothetical protein